MTRTSEDEAATAFKDAAVKLIDARCQELIDVSLEIHANPELCFKEFKASKLLADYLAANHFAVERGVYGLDTAFTAAFGTGKPRIAFVAEYDALESVGHGCGHNIIGTAAAAAGVAVASIVEQLGGTIVVIGTPAEELGGNGKEIMAREGAFADLDAAMMVHPWNNDMLCDSGAMVPVNIEYFGEASHPCTPSLGVNALDAMLVGYGEFNNFRRALLRQRSPQEALWGGILKAGDEPGLVPDHTIAFALPIAADEVALKRLIAKVHECFKAGESIAGVRMELDYDWENRYRAVYNNGVLSSLFDANMGAVRQAWNPVSPDSIIERAATDMGSVSQRVPSIHPWIAFISSDTGMHSHDSAAAAASEQGHEALLDGAKAMAMSAVDLFMSPEILERAWEEFRSTVL